MSLDFLAGCIGGCAGVLVGHPLDTIKVHLQTQDPKNPTYRGVWHCMKSIWAEDRVRGLYRGISSPMMGIGMVNAIVFGIYGNVQRHTTYPDSLSSHFLAGSIAGFAQSIVCAPMELAKTRIQLQHDTSKDLLVKHKGPIACLRYIVRTEGIRGAFKGLGITAMRDVPGFSSYFVSYEFMMRLQPNPNVLYTLFAGGMAGIMSWLACYPLDVIKTQLQADGMKAAPVYKGIIDCGRKGYAAEGAHFFVRGLASTLIRAFPMNAACFFVVSLVLRLTKGGSNGSGCDLLVNAGDGVHGLIEHLPNTKAHKLQQHYHWLEEVRRKRDTLSKSMKALGEFNEAVHHSEVEELVYELFPDAPQYYVLEEEGDLLKRMQSDAK